MPRPPVDPSRRDLMRELEAWWEKHTCYPKEAAQADVGGTHRTEDVVHVVLAAVERAEMDPEHAARDFMP
jgi:hypothetical protein